MKAHLHIIASLAVGLGLLFALTISVGADESVLQSIKRSSFTAFVNSTQDKQELKSRRDSYTNSLRAKMSLSNRAHPRSLLTVSDIKRMKKWANTYSWAADLRDEIVARADRWPAAIYG